jgi:hypothetical protein
VESSKSFSILGKRKIANSESPNYEKKRSKHHEDTSLSGISSVNSRDIFPSQVNVVDAQNLLKLQQQESVQTI